METPLSGFTATTVQGTFEELNTTSISSGSGFVSIGISGSTTGKYNVGDAATPTFESALAAAFADSRLSNGGIVLIMAGEYTLTTTVTIPPAVTLMGELAGTTIVGETTELPLFTINQTTDTTTIGADTGGGEVDLSAGAPADPVKLVNLILTDNSNSTIKSLGLPISTMKTVPMVNCQTASHLICEGVRFIGRVDYGGPANREKTLCAIGGYSAGGSDSSKLTVRECYFDAMKIAIDFVPSGGDIDQLIVDKCNARTFGTENLGSTDPEDNCFVTFTQCNATLTDNYHVSESNGAADTALYCFVMENSGGTSDIHVTITGNEGSPTTAGDRHILTYSTLSAPTTTAVPMIDGNTWGGYVPFTIDEDTTYGRVWRNVNSTIALQDKNMVDDSKNPVYLSSSTAADADTTLYIYDTEPPAGIPTIFKSLNARFTITVGDGSNSFGDFNGTTSIADALDWWQANCGSVNKGGVLILVKPGYYNFSSTYTISGSVVPNPDIIIQGVSKNACYLRNYIVTSSTTPMIETDATQVCKIELRDLTIQKNSTSAVAVHGQNCYVRFKRCRFNLQSFYYTVDDYMTDVTYSHPPVILVEDCQFYTSWTPSTKPSLYMQVSGDDGYGITGAIFRDCSFKTAYNSPLLQIVDDDSSGDSHLRDIRFEGCKIDLDTSTTGGGNPSGNSGVLSLTPGTNDALKISIEFINCNVKANRDEDTQNNILLYLQTDDGTNYIIVERLRISGGRWTWPNVDSNISPFYIGNNTWYTVAAPPIVECIIEDVVFGPEGTTGHDYGSQSTEIGGIAVVPQDRWGAMTISNVANLKIRNIYWNNVITSSGAADIFLASNIHHFDVDGIFMASWSNTGSAGVPEGRVIVHGHENNGGSTGSVRNIIMKPSGLSSNYPANGFFQLEPFGGLVLKDCAIYEGMNTPGAGPNGFYLIPSSTAEEQNGLELYGCIATECDCGFDYTGGVADTHLTGLIFKGCVFKDNGNTGLKIDTATGSSAEFSEIVIDNCTITGNDLGIIVHAGAVNAQYPTVFQMTNNAVRNNNDSADEEQVRLGGLNTGGNYQYSVMTGNDFGGNNSAVGAVWVYAAATTTQACLIHGAQTEFPNTGSINFSTGDLVHQQPFILNRGRCWLGNTAVP
jgi:hypothetical protein